MNNQNYYSTSKVIYKQFKEGVKSFDIHDKINFRSMYGCPVMFIGNSYKVII